VKKNPEKYGKKFKTMMPKKIWTSKTVEELEQLACKLGNHNADWVEQALEWAQRICNGESWETVCNYADTAKWYRVISWKNGDYRLVGGSRVFGINIPASNVLHDVYYSSSRVILTVPLVVLYEK